MIGTTEILILCGVVLVLFGAAAIPKFARSLGQARSEFHKGTRESEEKSAETNGSDEDS